MHIQCTESPLGLDAPRWLPVGAHWQMSTGTCTQSYIGGQENIRSSTLRQVLVPVVMGDGAQACGRSIIPTTHDHAPAHRQAQSHASEAKLYAVLSSANAACMQGTLTLHWAAATLHERCPAAPMMDPPSAGHARLAPQGANACSSCCCCAVQRTCCRHHCPPASPEPLSHTWGWLEGAKPAAAGSCCCLGRHRSSPRPFL
jgi:hypothetical protein